MKFIDSLKGDRPSNVNPNKGASESEAKGLAKADSLWIKTAQKQLVSDIGFEKLKKQFALFLDGEGIWRSGSCLSNADAPFCMKYPSAMKHPFLQPKKPPCHRSGEESPQKGAPQWDKGHPHRSGVWKLWLQKG